MKKLILSLMTGCVITACGSGSSNASTTPETVPYPIAGLYVGACDKDKNPCEIRVTRYSEPAQYLASISITEYTSDKSAISLCGNENLFENQNGGKVFYCGYDLERSKGGLWWVSAGTVNENTESGIIQRPVLRMHEYDPELGTYNAKEWTFAYYVESSIIK